MAIKRFLLKNPGKKVLILVPTEALLIQWNKIIDSQRLQFNCVAKIINTASKEQNTCDLLIIDEIHKIASPTFLNCLYNTKYTMALGLTATLERLDNRHKIIEKIMPVCDVVTVEEALINKWLSPVKQYLVMIEPDDISEYNKLNREFISHFSAFDYNFKDAMGCVKDFMFRNTYIKKKAIGMTEQEKSKLSKFIHASAFGFRNTLKARKAYCYNHPKKIEIANAIIEHNLDKKGITFWKTIAMCEKLEHGVVLHSGNTKKKNRTTLEEFNQQKTGWIHSSKALIEGVDCPGLSVAIVGGFDSSKTTNIQRIGRVIRFEEGKTAEIYILCLKGTVEEKWYKNSSVSSYSIITEHELYKKLNNQKFNEINKEKNEKSEADLMFRF